MRKLKLITGLSSVALAVAGCGAEGEGGSAEGEGAIIASADSEGEGVAAGEGESEGEGAAAAGDPSGDNVDYLFRLGMIRGHLAAFIELHRAGANEMARMHAKHPGNELYDALIPAFAARGKPGFADALDNLIQAEASNGDVEAAYTAAVSEIRANAPVSNDRTTLLAVARLVATAGEEFDIGVRANGVIIEPHEYQDAFGFLSAAREMVAEIKSNDIDVIEAVAVAHEQIGFAMASFNGLVVSETEGTSATLYGAAARIEIAALGL